MSLLTKNAAIAAVCFCLMAPLALAHSGATGIVKTRMDAMKSVASHMKSVGAMLKDQSAIDNAKVIIAAKAIADHAKAIPEQFPEGSMQMPSEATPTIWTDWERFVVLADDMAALADTLAETAHSGNDASAVRQAFAALGRSCSACHEDFRVRR